MEDDELEWVTQEPPEEEPWYDAVVSFDRETSSLITELSCSDGEVETTTFSLSDYETVDDFVSETEEEFYRLQEYGFVNVDIDSFKGIFPDDDEHNFWLSWSSEGYRTTNEKYAVYAVMIPQYAKSNWEYVFEHLNAERKIKCENLK